MKPATNLILLGLLFVTSLAGGGKLYTARNPHHELSLK
jgi:hypothetical protein